MIAPKEERELSVGGYVYGEDGRKAEKFTVYTSDPGLIVKYDRFVKENPGHWKIVETMTCQGDICGRRYEISAGCLLLRAHPVQITLSEEEKQRRAEALRQATQR